MISEARVMCDPEWARGVPEWRGILAGVLYSGLTHDVLFQYLHSSDVHCAWATTGPNLYPTRKAPRLAYSIDRVDRVRNMRVRDREWPWCLGDEVAFLVCGPAGVTVIDVQIDDEERGRLYLASATRVQSPAEFEPSAEEWVREILGPMAERLALPRRQPQ